MKLIILASLAVTLVAQQPRRLVKVMLAFDPKVSIVDSLMIVASLRDASMKALAAGPPILSVGKVTQSGSGAKMVVAFVNVATGATLAKDSVNAKSSVLRDSARVLGTRLAGRVH